MKKLMILGGLLGFLIGLVFGLVQGSSWPSIVWKASVATLLAGLLVRWWGRIWVRSLHESYEARLHPPSVPAAAAPKN